MQPVTATASAVMQGISCGGMFKQGTQLWLCITANMHSHVHATLLSLRLASVHATHTLAWC